MANQDVARQIQDLVAQLKTFIIELKQVLKAPTTSADKAAARIGQPGRGIPQLGGVMQETTSSKRQEDRKTLGSMMPVLGSIGMFDILTRGVPAISQAVSAAADPSATPGAKRAAIYSSMTQLGGMAAGFGIGTLMGDAAAGVAMGGAAAQIIDPFVTRNARRQARIEQRVTGGMADMEQMAAFGVQFSDETIDRRLEFNTAMEQRREAFIERYVGRMPNTLTGPGAEAETGALEQITSSLGAAFQPLIDAISGMGGELRGQTVQVAQKVKGTL